MSRQSVIEQLEKVLGPWLPPPKQYKSSKPNGATQPTCPKRMRAYAEGALEGERQKLAGMARGGRNNELYFVGCRVGKYVHHGVLSLDEVEGALLEACKGNGLIKEDGLQACKASLASGLRKAEGDDLPTLDDRVHPTVAAQPGAGDQRAVDDIKAWPKLKVASHGLVGELAGMATRDSEADPIAVMATTLAAGAAAFGRNRFMRVGDTLHHARLMSALVGATARGRKGTSWGPVERVMRAAESILQSGSTLSFPSGLSLRISYGPLSSGEGLIEAIRDKRGDDDADGTDDKRLLVVEGELGAALRACQRQGNTLSTLLRVAWDGWTLAPLTKRDKIVATDPHVCIVAHITRHELAELLTAADVWNGFANRFLWTVVRRRAEVPFPKAMTDADVQHIGKELARVIGYAHSREGANRELVMSNSAAAHWGAVYSELTQEHTGILGAVTSRAEAQTLRLAMTYALFAGADRIEIDHLEAALAFWRYSFDSAGYLFGGAELDPVAQTILQALATARKTQTEIRDLFGRHLPAERLAQVLTDLQERGRITCTEEETGGRPRKVWSLA
jgi:hypothetical protein